MTHQAKQVKSFKWLAPALLMALGSTQYAYGVGLMINAPSRLTGLANAGQAVYDNTATLPFTNPAAMAQFSSRFAEVHGTLASPNIDFNEDWDCKAESNCAGNSLGSLQPLPTAGFIYPINDRFTYGMTIGGVSGQGLDYHDNWQGRTLITDNTVEVASLANAFSYRINEKFSVGFTFEVLYGKFHQDLDLPAITGSRIENNLGAIVACGAALSPPIYIDDLPRVCDRLVDAIEENPGPVVNYLNGEQGTIMKMKGDDITTGVKLGFLYEINENNRLGLTYHQIGNLELEGEAKVKGDLLNVSNSSPDLKMSWDMPDKLVVSGGHQFNGNWELYWDFERVFYSTFEDNKVDIDGLVPLYIDRNFKDANRYALGAEYMINPQWTLQLGTSFDESPVDDSDRNADIPLDTFFKFFVGAIYEQSDSISISGYMGYEKLGDAKIERLGSVDGIEIGHKTTGDYDQTAWVAGASITKRF